MNLLQPVINYLQTRALQVSEIMFHPQAPPQGSPFDNDFEFVELVNVSPTDSINLENIAFTQGIGFTMGP